MLVHQVDAGSNHFARQIAFDLFDDERADHFQRVGVFDFGVRGGDRGGFGVGGTRLAKGQHGDAFGVRLFHVAFDRFFHLRRQVVVDPFVPERFARGDHARGE